MVRFINTYTICVSRHSTPRPASSTTATPTRADQLALEQGYVWDEAKAAAILTFAHAVFKPQYIAGDFKLLPWQARFLQSLVAWRKPDGSRRWKTANLHIAKKNGKTLLVSILCLFEFFCSTPSPFIASGSVTKENAGQVFSELRNSVRGLKAVKVTPNQRRMTLPKTNAEYRALSSDGDSAQGYNLSLAVVDGLPGRPYRGPVSHRTAAQPGFGKSETAITRIELTRAR